MKRALFLLLILPISGSGCMSSDKNPDSDDGQQAPENPTVWHRQLAYSLDNGGTLQVRVGDPQRVRASDWSIVAAWPLEILQKDSAGDSLMRIWIDEHMQQVRRDMPSCVDGQCNVFFDYVPAGTPAPPMLIPQSKLANFTWTEEDRQFFVSISDQQPATISLNRYGSLPTRPAGWAWTGWQGSISYDNESRPIRIDLTTVKPGTGAKDVCKGTLAQAELPQDWNPIAPNGSGHTWALNSNALSPWFPGFYEPVPGHDFSLASAHEYVLEQHDEARQAHVAQCTVKVGLGLVDSADSTVTPFGVGGELLEEENTQVSFGFPDDGGIQIWAIVRSEPDTLRPARYEEGGNAFMDGTPRCDEFGTRAGTVSFYDFLSWARLAAHNQTADSVHISWHDTPFHGPMATSSRLTASFGSVNPDAQVSASFAVVYYPTTGRLGGGLMPAAWIQSLDAQNIPAPTVAA